MWSKFLNMINRITEYVAMILLTTMVLVVFTQIISRVLLGSSFPWTDEVSRFLMIWVIFLGVAVAFQYNEHISIDILFNKLSLKLRKIVQFIVALICIAFCLVLIVKGFEFAQRTMVQRSPALNIPVGYVYFVIPISGILQILNVIDISFRYYRTGKSTREDEVW